MIALECVLSQRMERKAWEIYTANALGAIAGRLSGTKIELYSEIIESKKTIQRSESAESIVNHLLEIL